LGAALLAVCWDNYHFVIFQDGEKRSFLVAGRALVFPTYPTPGEPKPRIIEWDRAEIVRRGALGVSNEKISQTTPTTSPDNPGASPRPEKGAKSSLSYASSSPPPPPRGNSCSLETTKIYPCFPRPSFRIQGFSPGPSTTARWRTRPSRNPRSQAHELCDQGVGAGCRLAGSAGQGFRARSALLHA
jgi:hypothetical protein